MKCKNYIVSRHALNRTIERIILSQNIRLNKKQLEKNRKKAMRIIENDINTFFADSISGKYKYLYSGIKKGNICRKYVINRETDIILTVIDDINLSEEVQKQRLTLKNNKINIIKQENNLISEYIYTEIENNEYLFVTDPKTYSIYSFKNIMEVK